MPSTYTLISSNVLSSSAASVTFSAIPATYTDLVLRVSGRTDGAQVDDSLLLTINSTAGTAYSFTWLRGNAISASSGRSSSTSSISTSRVGLTASSATASTFGSLEIYIPSYTASQNKPIGFNGVGETNGSSSFAGAIAGLWSNTAAINQLDCAPGSGTIFVSGSSFYLYGIKNS